MVNIMAYSRENKALKLNDLEEWGRLNTGRELRSGVRLFLAQAIAEAKDALKCG